MTHRGRMGRIPSFQTYLCLTRAHAHTRIRAYVGNMTIRPIRPRGAAEPYCNVCDSGDAVVRS